MTDREDVITLLERQHKEIRRLFGEVEKAKGDARREAFRDLVRLLSVHETAEENGQNGTRRRRLRQPPRQAS